MYLAQSHLQNVKYLTKKKSDIDMQVVPLYLACTTNNCTTKNYVDNIITSQILISRIKIIITVFVSRFFLSQVLPPLAVILR